MAAISTGSGSRDEVNDRRSNFGPVLFRDRQKAGTDTVAGWPSSSNFALNILSGYQFIQLQTDLLLSVVLCR